MKIYFERSGGFLGRSVSVVVDTNRLPPEEALGLLEKVEQAEFFDLPESPAGSHEGFQGADQLCYKVTIEIAGVEHTVETSDVDAPEALQPLLQELSQLAREPYRSPVQPDPVHSGHHR